MEIKEKARIFGVPVSTIERDYAQNWLLKHISKINMVLKGGTGIKKVYNENYRFSDDLDFTLSEKFNENNLNNEINSAIESARDESGIDFSQNIKLEKNINGFTTGISINLIQRGGLPVKIKLDITDFDKEKIILPILNKEIIHTYSDSFKAKTPVYNLKEIIAEKIRALFERTRPRDLYDVWYFLVESNLKVSKDITGKKIKFKKVKIDLSSLEKRKNDFAHAWKNSLNHQINNLPDFELVYNKTINILKEYETSKTKI
ncbi:MAG: nucleotidyl transferase AbiEii/AbiGii toxin family protein [Candidatus Cloacimonetes bacterium]|nr:nucleotidyl transferase AbiEii/AbiGii toxin family protein [Candidatus Cloacimonadota bacterium]